MNEQRIRELVRQLDTTDLRQIEATWEQLRALGEAVVPFVAEAYPAMKRWQGRASLLCYSTPYAHTSRAALELGLAALADRATVVRYRACGVLAYALNAESVPALEELLSHPDQKTVDDAKAAIDAIEHQNHHYFLDRGHTGRIRWEMHTPADAEALDALEQAASTAAAEASKGQEPRPPGETEGKAGGCAGLVLLALWGTASAIWLTAMG